MDLDVVRNLMCGATAWPENLGPLGGVLRGALQATAETENIRSTLVAAPAQALARLHLAAAGHLLPQSQVGRPRQAGEISREFSGLGPSPDEDIVRARLSGIVVLLLCAGDAPALVVASLVHAEIASVRPFVCGNGLVARALERTVIQASGLDPTGVAVVETGHHAGGGAAYRGALAAYASGSRQGVEIWMTHCARAIVTGAQEGGRIADAVLAGRLT